MKFREEEFLQTLLQRNRLWSIEAVLQKLAAAFNLAALAFLSFVIARQWRGVSPAPWYLAASFALVGCNVLQFVLILYFRRRWIDIENNATQDELTGLHSAGYFDKMLDQELRRAGRYRYPIAVCRLDLEGLEVGDQARRQFSDVIRAASRFSDCAAYLRVDEFVVLLPHTDTLRAEKYLKRLMAQAEERFELGFSAGVTAFRPGESGAEFLERAERALAEAKRDGRKQVRCLASGTDSHAVVRL
jgi:diguanylate cyclase (GGDEF)-like protein